MANETVPSAAELIPDFEKNAPMIEQGNVLSPEAKLGQRLPV
jgi:hypothetical protein